MHLRLLQKVATATNDFISNKIADKLRVWAQNSSEKVTNKTENMELIEKKLKKDICLQEIKIYIIR